MCQGPMVFTMFIMCMLVFMAVSMAVGGYVVKLIINDAPVTSKRFREYNLEYSGVATLVVFGFFVCVLVFAVAFCWTLERSVDAIRYVVLCCCCIPLFQCLFPDSTCCYDPDEDIRWLRQYVEERAAAETATGIEMKRVSADFFDPAHV